MNSLWNGLESLQVWSRMITWAMLIAALVTAFLGLLLQRLNDRISDLQEADKERQLEEAKRRADAILKKTPGQQPVYDASASVGFRVESSAVIRTTNNKSIQGWTAMLEFMGTNGESLRMGTPDLDWWGPSTPQPIQIQFKWKQGAVLNELSEPNESADDLARNLDRLKMTPFFLQHPTEVLGGQVTLVLNGSVAKIFSIPSQSFFMERTNDPGKTHMWIDGFASSSGDSPAGSAPK